MKINNVSPAFKGYKNVLAYDYINTPQSRFSILSFEINDEDGYNDLTEYKALRKIYTGNDDKFANRNLITCIYAKKGENLELAAINALPIFTDKVLNKLTGDNKSKTIERAQLKANTLLAGITRRMMQNGLSVTDSGFGNVIKNTMTALAMFGLNMQEAFHIVETACIKNQPADRVGALFNDYIQRSMIKYFK